MSWNQKSPFDKSKFSLKATKYNQSKKNSIQEYQCQPIGNKLYSKWNEEYSHNCNK